MKEEVVGLVLRNDMVTMRYAAPSASPVPQRLLPVIHSVYTQHIEPKNHQSDISAKWELIKTTWNNSTDGVIVLHHLVFLVGNEQQKCFDDRLLSRAIAKYKQQVLNWSWELVLSTLESFDAAIGDLNSLALELMYLGNGSDRRELACRVEEAINLVGDKLRVLELWKALCEGTEEPWARKFMKQEMLSELFPNVPHSIQDAYY